MKKGYIESSKEHEFHEDGYSWIFWGLFILISIFVFVLARFVVGYIQPKIFWIRDHFWIVLFWMSLLVFAFFLLVGGFVSLINFIFSGKFNDDIGHSKIK